MANYDAFKAYAKILPHKKAEKINQAFHETITLIKANVIDALEYSVRREARHIYGCFNPSEKEIELLKTIKHISFEKNSYEDYNGKTHHSYYINGVNQDKMSLYDIQRVFSMKGWDSSYGGKRWAKGTEMLIALKNSKNVTEDVFLIDRILDLHHNTGFILNKTEFDILDHRVEELISIYYSDKNYKFDNEAKKRLFKKSNQKYSTVLNYRKINDPGRFIDLCSENISKLWIANKNYLKV